MRKIRLILSILISVLFYNTYAQFNESETHIRIKNHPQLQEEFKKVLKEFKNSPLKRKAACFLFYYMPYHHSTFVSWYDENEERIDFNELDYPNMKTSVLAFESIKKDKKLHTKTHIVYDTERVTADFIIKHINTVFSMRNRAWNKYLSFEDFCEYILPYRVMNEPLQDYQDRYQKEFAYLISQMKNSGEHFELQCLVNLKIGSFYENSFGRITKNNHLPLQGPLTILHRKQGDCTNMANYATYSMRMLGLPVGVDFTPWYATSTGTHFWNITWDQNGKGAIFLGTSKNPGEYYIPRELGKVFRYSYKLNEQWISNKIQENKIPPLFFRNRFLFDVTNEYGPTSDIKIKPIESSLDSYAYISVFNGLSWKPIFYGKYDCADKCYQFSNMGRGCVYLPVNYDNEKFIPLSWPYLLRRSGQIEMLKPDLTKKKLCIPEKEKYLIFRKNKKYALFYWKQKWIKIGVQTAQNHSPLYFEGVPNNALLLLVPEYSNRKERIFTVTKNGKIEYW